MRGDVHDDGKVMVVFSCDALASVSNLLECNDVVVLGGALVVAICYLLFVALLIDIVVE